MNKIVSILAIISFLQIDVFGQEDKMQSLFKVYFSKNSQITLKKEFESIMSNESTIKTLQKFNDNYEKKLKTKLKNQAKLSKQDSLYLFHNEVILTFREYYVKLKKVADICFANHTKATFLCTTY